MTWRSQCLVLGLLSLVGQLAIAESSAESSSEISTESPTKPANITFNRLRTRVGVDAIKSFKASGDSSLLFFVQEDIRGRLGADAYAASYEITYHIELDALKEDQSHLLEENFERLTASVDKPLPFGQIGFGLKKLTWGETVSLPILDITNPRSLRNTRGYYDSSAKISTLMVTGQVLLDSMEITSFLTLWPREAHLPDEIGDFTVRPRQRAALFGDMEGGIRLATMIRSFDLNLMYVHHAPRLPSFIIAPFDDDGDLELNDEMVHTLGMSFSWAGFEHIFRGDFRYSLGKPVSGVVQAPLERDLVQGILGFDYLPHVNSIVGLELHYDNWGTMPYHFSEGAWATSEDSSSHLLWYGPNVRLNILNNLLESSLLYLRGFEREDELVRLKFDLHPRDSWVITLEGQKTSFGSSSPRYVLSEQERVLLGLHLFI